MTSLSHSRTVRRQRLVAAQAGAEKEPNTKLCALERSRSQKLDAMAGY